MRMRMSLNIRSTLLTGDAFEAFDPDALLLETPASRWPRNEK